MWLVQSEMCYNTHIRFRRLDASKKNAKYLNNCVLTTYRYDTFLYIWGWIKHVIRINATCFLLFFKQRHKESLQRHKESLHYVYDSYVWFELYLCIGIDMDGVYL